LRLSAVAARAKKLMSNRPVRHPTSASSHLHARILRLMVTPRISRTALKVSLVVGTVLNVINNGEQLWTLHTVNLWSAMLNFVVPFCVSSYSAARNETQIGPKLE
jgi:hypothetical protein